jgi:putative aldouronate transport system substrate-binding protein
MANDGVKRRDFLRVVAGGAVLMPGLLAACTPAAPITSPTAAKPASSAPTAAGAAAPTAAAAAKPSGVLPSYMPLQNGPKPDYASAGPQYEDGWDNYPMPPIQAWTKNPPGLGSRITAFTNSYNPPSTPLEQNPAWQEVNKQLNANVNFTVTPPGDYAAKMAALMAGDDLPDIMLFPGGVNVTLGGSGGTTNLPAFLQSKCADLTPFLAGDAVKEYPYLAAIPTYSWKNSGSAVNGHLYMLPIQRYVPGTSLFKNTTYYDKEIGADYVPKDAADLKRVYQQLNRPQENRWATAAYQNIGLHILFYAALWGAPNNWAYDTASGKLTKNFEAPEFQAAVGYARDLWASGLYHPNTLNYSDINAARLDFVGGKFALYPEGFGQPWQDFWRRGLKNNPPYNFIPLPPFAAQQGGKPTHFLGPGFLSTNAFKKASDERIKELLRIFDFLASPFGSQEDLLLQYGIKDIHYTLDSSGKLTLNERSNADANYVNWKYLIQHPQVMYVPDIPGYGKAEYEAEHVLIPAGIYDPTLGYYSATQGTKGAVLNRTMMDGITDVIAGRRPLEDYPGLVKDWASAGGDQIRKELQEAIAQGGAG